VSATAGKQATRCGAGVEANRVFEDVRSMVRWARGRGDLDSNLTEGMRRPTETQERDRWLSDDEIRKAWVVLRRLKCAKALGEYCGCALLRRNGLAKCRA
jgi:hypothetical protein